MDMKRFAALLLAQITVGLVFAAVIKSHGVGAALGVGQASGGCVV